MDRIFLRGIELHMRVGCTARERAFPQRLWMDVDLELPLKAAGAGDDLRKTVDYAAVAVRVRRAVEPRAFRLIEAVAETAARAALRDGRVKRATIRVRKSVLPGMDHAGVEITRP